MYKLKGGEIDRIILIHIESERYFSVSFNDLDNIELATAWEMNEYEENSLENPREISLEESGKIEKG